MWVHNTAVLVLSYGTQLFANDLFNRCVSCFSGLPESVVLSKTVAEFKRRLSEVDLSSFLMYNFNNSTGYTLSDYANNPVYTIKLSTICIILF